MSKKQQNLKYFLEYTGKNGFKLFLNAVKPEKIGFAAEIQATLKSLQFKIKFVQCVYTDEGVWLKNTAGMPFVF